MLLVACILKGNTFVFLYRCSYLHVHEKNMNIFNTSIHVYVDSVLYLYHWWYPKHISFVLLLKCYFSHFIPEPYRTPYVIVCGLSLSFALSLIWAMHGVETQSSVCSCSRLIYSACQGISSSHLEATRQFIVPKLVGTPVSIKLHVVHWQWCPCPGSLVIVLLQPCLVSQLQYFWSVFEFSDPDVYGNTKFLMLLGSHRPKEETFRF